MKDEKYRYEMIDSLRIENFKAINKLEVEKLHQVNLIGGKNNIGKTILLEAISLMGSPSAKSIARIMSYRRINKEFLKAMPSRAWESFFYNFNVDENVEFIYESDGEKVKITLSNDANVNNKVISFDDIEDAEAEYIKSLSDEKSSALTISINDKSKKVYSTPKGLALEGSSVDDLINISYIPAHLKINNHTIAELFDKHRLDKYDYESSDVEVLKAFNVIDPSIEKALTLSIGEPEIYLARKGEKPMPLTYFGDAMNRVGNLILSIIDNPNGIVLIDEFENGIHYKNQEQVFTILFDMAKKYNVQLFITTHSIEAMSAFNRVQFEKPEITSSYYELYKNVEVDHLKLAPYDMDQLKYAIEMDGEIRGE